MRPAPGCSQFARGEALGKLVGTSFELQAPSSATGKPSPRPMKSLLPLYIGDRLGARVLEEVVDFGTSIRAPATATRGRPVRPTSSAMLWPSSVSMTACGERLRRGDADPGPADEGCRRPSRAGNRTDDVGHGERASTLGSGLAEARSGIGRLAALGDRDHQRVVVDRRRGDAVPVGQQRDRGTPAWFSASEP